MSRGRMGGAVQPEQHFWCLNSQHSVCCSSAWVAVPSLMLEVHKAI